MAAGESRRSDAPLHLVSRERIGAALPPQLTGRRRPPVSGGRVGRAAGRVDRSGPHRARQPPVNPGRLADPRSDQRTDPFRPNARRSKHDEPRGVARRAVARLRARRANGANRWTGLRCTRRSNARGGSARVRVLGRADEDCSSAPRTNGPAGVRQGRSVSLCRPVFRRHQPRRSRRCQRPWGPLPGADFVRRRVAGRRPTRAADRDIVELRVPRSLRRSPDRDLLAGFQPRRLFVAARRRSSGRVDDAHARKRDRRRGHDGRRAAPDEPTARARNVAHGASARDARTRHAAPRARRVFCCRVLRGAGGHPARRSDRRHLPAAADARRRAAGGASSGAGPVDGGISRRSAWAARTGYTPTRPKARWPRT